MTPRFKPPTTKLLSGQSIYYLDHNVTLICNIFLQMKLINKYLYRFFMKVIFFANDTRIRTSQSQDYRREVYLLDHNVTEAVVPTSTIFFMCIYYYCIFAKHRCTT